jgi:hypothetical protein
MSKNDRGAAARAAFSKGEADRKADNAAAAREEAEKNRPPVVCLGREGSQYVLYSTAYRRIERLTAEKLNLPNLRAIAPRAHWEKWLFPERVAAGDEVKRGELVEAIQERILADCGAKMFDASCVRGRGVWPDTAGGWVYNAGASCWWIPADGGKVEQVDNARDGHVYSAGVALPFPADTPLSDEEGRELVELLRARSWVLPGAGDIMAGWMVAALLAGVMPICPHVWINAPAGTGKTYLKNDLVAVLGGLSVQVEGAATTEAAIRQRLSGAALPFLADEVEQGDNETAGRNISKWLDLMRSASYGGNIDKGGTDGTARAYPMKCSFALFSIANCISRDADSSRCLVLHLSRGDKAVREVWARQDAGRALVQTPGFHGRLMARLLGCLPLLLENLSALRKQLGQVEGVDARRAELFAVLLSCRHALVSHERMCQDAMQEAAGLMLAYGEQEEKESDFSRCLAVLLGHVVRVRGQEMTVADACRVMDARADAEAVTACGLSLSAAGLRWLDDVSALQVDTLADKMKRIFTGTQWSNGKVAPVLAEGVDRNKGKKGANALGVYYRCEPKLGRRKCVVIPAALVLGDE